MGNRVKLYEYLGIPQDGLQKFSTADVCDVVGVTRYAFQKWNEKYFQPSIKAAPRPGVGAEWSLGDLVGIMVFKNLLDIGVKGPMAYTCAANIGPHVDIPDGIAEEKNVWIEIYPDGSAFGVSRIVAEPSRAVFDTIDPSKYETLVGVNLTAIMAEIKNAIS